MGFEVDLIDIILSIQSKEIIAVDHFDFTGDGMNIPYNTLPRQRGEERRKSCLV